MNKTPQPILILLGSIFGLASFPLLHAQDSVATDPVGYKTVTIKGDNGLNIIGIEFLEPPEYSGPVSNFGNNTVTVAGTDFDALLDEGTPYFLEVASGDNEGLSTSIVDWSNDTLTLGDDLSAFTYDENDTVRVHRLLTIEEVFGEGGDVLEGGFPIDADLVLIPNPNGEGLNRYYYSTGGFAGTGWRQVGESGDKSDVPIYYSDGLYVFKRSAGDVDLVVSGTVKITSSDVVVEEGFTPFSTIYPSGTTLGNSGLYDPNNLSQSIESGFPTTADLVLTDSNGDGSLERYYYSAGGFAGEGWRQVGESGDKSSVSLASGFAIFKRSNSVVVKRDPSFN
ncbi:MAG: TIGR02597 family protein [Opitutales bacterium]